MTWVESFVTEVYKTNFSVLELVKWDGVSINQLCIDKGILNLAATSY